jgi:hypothetical protein
VAGLHFVAQAMLWAHRFLTFMVEIVIGSSTARFSAARPPYIPQRGIAGLSRWDDKPGRR